MRASDPRPVTASASVGSSRVARRSAASERGRFEASAVSRQRCWYAKPSRTSERASSGFARTARSSSRVSVPRVAVMPMSAWSATTPASVWETAATAPPRSRRTPPRSDAAATSTATSPIASSCVRVRTSVPPGMFPVGLARFGPAPRDGATSAVPWCCRTRPSGPRRTGTSRAARRRHRSRRLRAAASRP